MRAVAYALALVILVALFPAAGQAGPDAQAQPPLPHDDALVAPPPSRSTIDSVADARGPSQFMAGAVAVLVVLPESDGAIDRSREDWTPEQVDRVRGEVQSAFDWWAARLPLAGLSFRMRLEIVPTSYEPTTRGLEHEGLWIGETLGRLGYRGSTYFDQAYAAAAGIRDQLGADWGTVLFVPNSADGSGYLADGRFAYAYINGPHLVVTSDAGSYGADDLDAVVAHELGHTFGALDQYSSARIACDRRSGYLNAPTSNSQYNGCGTRLPSIMLDAAGAFRAGQIDSSALHQVGYRDGDSDGIIDPLDTEPALVMRDSTLASSTGRPVIRGAARDLPFPSAFQNDVTLNTIARVEFRVDGGPWLPASPTDGAFDGAVEEFSAELPLYDGSYGVEIRAVNSIGAASATVADRVDVSWVGPAPRYGVSGPALTSRAEVELLLNAPAGTEAVQVSEDASFAGAKWLPVTPVLSYALASGDGPRTVFVRFRDQFALTSLPLAAALVLDTQPPQGTAIRPPAEPTRLVLSASDALTAVTDVEVSVGQEAPRWVAYATTLEIPQMGGEQPVVVRFRDAAGNVSPPAEAAAGYTLSLPLLHR